MTDVHTMILHRGDGRAAITLKGEIDLHTLPAVRAALDTCRVFGLTEIDVDLRSVRFCDASGLQVLLATSRRCTAAGGDLRLHRPAPAVRRLLGLTGTSFLLAEGRVPPESADPPWAAPAAGRAA